MEKLFFKKIFFNLMEVLNLSSSFLFSNPEKQIAKILTNNNLTLATAESCTGGLISSRLTDISGSSSYIKENFITYVNEAKNKYLEVSLTDIEKYGVVSKEIAIQMAQGLLKISNCDIAISTTGIAGPTGETSNKPVGLVYIAIADKNNVISLKFNANHLFYRRIMKYKFSQAALEFLLNFLKENYKGDN